MNKQAGFSLLEVLIALGITSLFLIALLRLQVSSTKIVSEISLNFSGLPVAIEQMEEEKEKQILEKSTKEVENFTVIAYREKEILKEASLDKLVVKILYNNEELEELTWYDFKNIKLESVYPY